MTLRRLVDLRKRPAARTNPWVYLVRVLPSSLGDFVLWLWAYWPVIAVGVAAALLGLLVGKTIGPWWGALAALVSMLVIPKACLMLAYVVHTLDKALSGRREERDRRRR